MGCDIHLYVEKHEGGKWVTADKWTPDKYAEEGTAPRLTVDYDDRFFTGRNYNLFAILADVRNGRGFAGCDTGDGFIPIKPPRGLPKNVSELVRAESESWDCDGHSHSYFTVSELLLYDWTQKTKCRGFINGPQFEEWKRMQKWEPQPKEWCGGITGPAIVTVHASTLEASVEAIRQSLLASSGATYLQGAQWQAFADAVRRELRNTYAQVEWTITYAECCKQWWWDVIPRLLQVGKPSDVRIVFWFDN